MPWDNPLPMMIDIVCAVALVLVPLAALMMILRLMRWWRRRGR